MRGCATVTACFYTAGQIGRPLLEARKKSRGARFPGKGLR